MVKTSPGRPIDPSKDRDILAAGRALLFEQGPQSVTMEAVARAAGVAKPTLYRRYANRDELLAAVALNESESMAGRFRMTPGSADDLKRALIDFGCDRRQARPVRTASRQVFRQSAPVQRPD